ncbi:MAG: FkbM family methyltransferase [Ignavibacterium sp.]|jgi:FkbM family methyltransferase|nr:FkbM family methyltransferase [Ignavibacterium sp.]
MRVLKNIAIRLTGNFLAQKLLRKNLEVSSYLMGIGAGTNVKESGELVLVKQILHSKKNKTVIFDVGANVGLFSNLMISELTGKLDYELHSFEPSRTTFKELEKNIKPGENIYLNNFAFGKEKKKSSLFYDFAGSGLASLTKRKLEHFNINFDYSEDILVDTLDNYCQNKNIESIDLLKIDVEGHELDVLIGGADMFSNKKIKLVSFEFGGSNIDTKTYYRDFYYFFKEYKMKIYRITPSSFLVPMNGYKEIYEQFRTTNFIATLETN